MSLHIYGLMMHYRPNPISMVVMVHGMNREFKELLLQSLVMQWTQDGNVEWLKQMPDTMVP